MNSKYELKIKLDEIKSLMKDKEFEAAVDIADSVDWSSIKDVNTLGMISDLYKKGHYLEDSREILLYAYARQHSKPVVKSLCELSIMLGDVVNAMDFFNEFKQMAPNSPDVLILQYKIYRARNISLEEQIEVLENLKEIDKGDGKWLYELATLYHRAGMESKCVEECEETILWCVDGKYVIKAYELKAQHKPLTEKENFNYEVLRQSGGKLNIQYSLREDEHVEPEKKEFSVGQDVSPFNTQNLQAVIAEGIQEVIDGKTANVPVEHSEPLTYEQAVALDNAAKERPNSEMNSDTNLLVTQMFNPVIAEEPVGQELLETESEDIKGRSDTDIIGTETRIMAKDFMSNRKSVEEAPVSDKNDSENVNYVLNQDTDEIKQISIPDDSNEEEGPEEVKVEASTDETSKGEVSIEEVSKAETPLQNTDKEEKLSVAEENEKALMQSTGVTKKPRMDAINNTGIIETFHKGSNLDGILTQGYDGQISIVIPESQQIEKQITGQLSIDDVMQEWERKKKESEERMVADVKSRVKSQAASLLADFEEGTKSDLLEQIESVMVSAALKEEKSRIAAGRPKEIKVSDIDKKDAELKAQALKAEKLAEEERRKAKEEAELKAKQEAELRAKQEAELKAKQEAELKAKKEKEIKAAVEKLTNGEDYVPESEEDGIEEIAEIEDTEEEVDLDDNVEIEDISEEDDASLETSEDEEYDDEDLEEDIEDEDEYDDYEDEESEEDSHPKEHNYKSHERRELSASEKERFSVFIRHRKTQKQLVHTLDNVTLASYTGNILVTAEEDSEITTFSKLLIQEIQQSDSNFIGKVAMVSGDRFNDKDVRQVLEKVKNGALIIADPQFLKKSTIRSLLDELNRDGFGVIIVMQGSPDVIDIIVEQNEGMDEIFNLRVDLKAFDNKTLVEYARSYAYDREYFIDEMGELALYTRISDLQTADHDVTFSEIEELIDEAISYANKKTPQHFFDILLGKRYDKEDMIVLKESDFMHY